MTLRQRYIAFGVVFAIITVGAMGALGYWLTQIDDTPTSGVAVSTPPPVSVTGERIRVDGVAVKLPNGVNGLRAKGVTYTLTGDPALQEKIAEVHGSRIRIVGTIVGRKSRLIAVNRFFDLSDLNAGPTPETPEPLPPERPTRPDGSGVARPGQAGTPGGQAVDAQGKPTTGTLPAVGQVVSVTGVIRIADGGAVVLVANRGTSHRIWGSPGLINRLRGLDGHSVTVTGNAILGTGSNRNYTINATRVVDRGRAPSTPTTPSKGTTSTPAPVVPPPVAIIGPGGNDLPKPPPAPTVLFSSGFEDGTSAWAIGCGEAGALRVLDAGACGRTGAPRGAPRIAVVADPVRDGERALSVSVTDGDGAITGASNGRDESSLPWTRDSEGAPGTTSIWKLSFRLRDGESGGRFAAWKPVNCALAAPPVSLAVADGALAVGIAGGSCANPRLDAFTASSDGQPWNIPSGAWNDLQVTITWGYDGRGRIAIRDGGRTWSRDGLAIGYRSPDERVALTLGLERPVGISAPGTVYFDNVTYAMG